MNIQISHTFLKFESQFNQFYVNQHTEEFLGSMGDYAQLEFIKKTKTMRSKDASKHLVGQPIFKELIDLIPKTKFDYLVEKYQTNRYYTFVISNYKGYYFVALKNL